MSLEQDIANDRELPGLKGEINEVLKFPTIIVDCNGKVKKIVIETRHTIKKGKNGGWSDTYSSNGHPDCENVHEMKAVKIPYDILPQNQS